MMATELSQLSLSQLQKLVQQQQQYPNSISWAWNGRQPPEDDESCEVRAFTDDTGSFMGSTWPPRSYTCNFCRREFQSAQALGGHMNVHRRDRARLRQFPPNTDRSTSPNSLISLPPDFAAGGGFCLVYPFPTRATVEYSASTSLSISPYPRNGLVSPSFSKAAHVDASLSHSGKVGSIGRDEDNKDSGDEISCNDGNKGFVVEEVDLELRLGW